MPRPKTVKLLYRISTYLLAGMMFVSAVFYLILTEEIGWVFHDLGFPEFMVLPLGLAKFLGAIALVQRRFAPLREWAYAGFCFDYIWAMIAHLNAADNLFIFPMVALIILAVSYWSARQQASNPAQPLANAERESL